MNCNLDIPSPDQALCDSIKRALDQPLEKIAAEEITKAKFQIETRVRALLPELAATLFSHHDMAFDPPSLHLKITVKIN